MHVCMYVYIYIYVYSCIYIYIYKHAASTLFSNTSIVPGLYFLDEDSHPHIIVIVLVIVTVIQSYRY